MPWEVVLLQEVVEWYVDELLDDDPETSQQVAAALDVLEQVGPTLGRPLVDRIQGSRLHNLKELRPGSSGQSEVRILLIFDVERQGLLLVAGDKSGNWAEWYVESIPLAEERYERWTKGDYRDEIEG